MDLAIRQSQRRQQEEEAEGANEGGKKGAKQGGQQKENASGVSALADVVAPVM